MYAHDVFNRPEWREILTYAFMADEDGVLQPDGTPHVHMYLVTRIRRRFMQFRKYLQQFFPECRVETCYASHTKNMNYTAKEGLLQFEIGVDPDEALLRKRQEQGKKKSTDYNEVLQLAREGRVGEIDPALLIRHYRAIQDLKNEVKMDTKPLDHQAGIWLWGPKGTFKTSNARAAFEADADLPQGRQLFYDKANSKWWGGYMGEPFVILDDLSLTFARTHEGKDLLKRMGGPHPFAIEKKGSEHYIRPHAVIITANFPPEAAFPDKDTDLDPILKRYTVVYVGNQGQIMPDDIALLLHNLPRVVQSAKRKMALPPSMQAAVHTFLGVRPRSDDNDYNPSDDDSPHIDPDGAAYNTEGPIYDADQPDYTVPHYTFSQPPIKGHRSDQGGHTWAPPPIVTDQLHGRPANMSFSNNRGGEGGSSQDENHVATQEYLRRRAAERVHNKRRGDRMSEARQGSLHLPVGERRLELAEEWDRRSLESQMEEAKKKTVSDQEDQHIRLAMLEAQERRKIEKKIRERTTPAIPAELRAARPIAGILAQLRQEREEENKEISNPLHEKAAVRESHPTPAQLARAAELFEQSARKKMDEELRKQEEEARKIRANETRELRAISIDEQRRERSKNRDASGGSPSKQWRQEH